MHVYTVYKPKGTKDQEFEAYTRLLEDVGINVADSPRVPEPGTDRRWLYAWNKKLEAERFAAEVRRRTGDLDWSVQDLDDVEVQRGPVAPLEIASTPESDGVTYYLTPLSRERIAAAFPGTGVPFPIHVTKEAQFDALRDRGDAWWTELSRVVTGRDDEEIDSLGGFRILTAQDSILFQRIPGAVA